MAGEGVHNKYTLDKYSYVWKDLLKLCAHLEFIEKKKKRKNKNKNQWQGMAAAKGKKIAKHTNHRDKSWSANAVE